MSATEYLKRLLENRWQESIDGRPYDVPQPAIVLNTRDIKRRLNTEDIIQVTAPGTTQITPKTFNEVDVTDKMTVEIRAMDRANVPDNVRDDPYKRVFGGRDQNNEAYRWSGISGEVLRILFSVYRGHKEFQKITPPTVDDLSDQTGPNHARAEIGVDLEQLASSTDDWRATQ